MAHTILVRRGAAAGIPALAEGEPGFTTDNHKLWVGSAAGNVNVRNNLPASAVATPADAAERDLWFYVVTTAELWPGMPWLPVGISGTPELRALIAGVTYRVVLDAGRVVTAISYTSSTGTIWTPSAACIITQCMIIRTTAWDGAPSLTIGHAGDADWLTIAAQARLTTAVPAGELAGVETINCNAYVDGTRPVTATWAQGGASAGAGYIVISYIPLT